MLPKIDKLFIILLILQVLIFKWLINKDIIFYLSILIIYRIFYTILKRKKIYKFNYFNCFCICLLIFIVILNILLFGIGDYFIYNFIRGIFTNIIILFYFSWLIQANREGLKNFFFKEIFWLFNFYFVINIPIILLQLNGTYFLMKYTENNPMYEDHITGLIGSSGTHRLTFFWIVLMLLNLLKINREKNRTLTIVSIFYFIFMVFVASLNDNTAFFFLFPLAIVIYFFSNVKKINTTTLLKLIRGGVIVIITGIIIYLSIPSAKVFVNDKVVDKLIQYQIIGNYDNRTDITDDEERIELYKYALEYGNGRGFGSGIGSIKSYGDLSMPRHFGMSEISIRVYEGGIIYLISIILVFSILCKKIFYSFRQFPLYIIIFLYIMLCIYTTICSDTHLNLLMGLIVMFLGFKYNKSERRV